MNFWLANNFLKYKLFSKHKFGHGIHSPFVYEFITKILNDKSIFPEFHNIEAERKKLLKSNIIIDVEDLGAGSKKLKSTKREVSKITRYSLKNKKYSQLIYKISAFYKPKNIIELGTSLGITTSYLATSNIDSSITTIEGCKNIAKIARTTFFNLEIENITQIAGDFSNELKQVLETNSPDLIFFDGNHQYKATIDYFNLSLNYINNDSIFIFDDIYWSKEMTKAWEEIKHNKNVIVSIDLFNLGIVFFNKNLSKQNFIIKY